MEIIEVNNYTELSERACFLLLDTIRRIENPVLGLATGSTPEGLYKNLIKNYKEEHVSFKHVSTFNLDEYVGLNPNHPNSYCYYMDNNLYKHIDIPVENTHVPNGLGADLEKECMDYERKIHKAGRVDIQILGLGLNGHIGFNEPGTPFSSRTSIVDLKESTRQANARFFASIKEVPKQAITMGIETIMESNKILLLASGAKKAGALAQLIHGEVTEDFPASILQKHDHVTVITDEEALRKV